MPINKNTPVIKPPSKERIETLNNEIKNRTPIANLTAEEQRKDIRVPREQIAASNIHGEDNLKQDAAIGNIALNESRHERVSKNQLGGNTTGGTTAGTTTPPTDPNAGTGIERPVLDFGSSETDLSRLQESRFANLESPTLAGIQETQRARAQGTIDATEQLFQEQLARLKREGDERLAGTSSIQTSAGLAGSPFKQAQEEKEKEKTTRIRNEFLSKRQAGIDSAFARADEKADIKFQNERQFFSNERDAQINFEKERQTESRAIVGQFFASGGKVSELQPQQLDDIMGRTGFGNFEMEIFGNANQPKVEQPDISYKQIGDKMVGYYTELDENGEPQLKTFESESLFDEAESGTEMDWQFQNGQFIGIPKDLDTSQPGWKDQIKTFGDPGEFSEDKDVEAPKTIGSGSTGFLQFNPETKKWEKIAGTGGGAGISNEVKGLVDAVIANPELFDTLNGSDQADIIPELHRQGFTQFGKPLSDVAITKITDIENSLESLDTLRDTLDEFKQFVGPVSGLQALNPWSEAKQAQAVINAVKQRVGKALEGGVLRKEDEEKYKKILPQINDTYATAQSKLDTLEKMINRDLSTYKRNQIAGGRNVPDVPGDTTIEEGVSLPKLNQSYSTIDSLIRDNPKYEDEVNRLIEEFAPKIEDDDELEREILDIIEKSQQDFNNESQTSPTGKVVTATIPGRSNIKVDESIKDKLERADKEFFEATGNHLVINESFRNRERQQELFERGKKEGFRAAPPGRSFHEKGLALDIRNWREAEPFLRKHGFKNDLEDDKNHFSIGEFA